MAMIAELAVRYLRAMRQEQVYKLVRKLVRTREKEVHYCQIPPPL